jgi:tRNA (guanine37-N1)-methyltransferase
MKKKIRFDIISIFPQVFEGYFSESILGRAQEKKLIDLRLHDLRQWSPDKRHRKVDDKPYSGGPGMVMMVEPFYRALRQLRALKWKKPESTRVILMSAKGNRLNHKEVLRLAEYDRIVLLCGRYEGVDERVAVELCDEEISIGDFVLTGGEIAAMTVVDAVSRYVPGVLGDSASLEQESHVVEGEVEYPQYTRPEIFYPEKGVKWEVPRALLSGDPRQVESWRKASRKS